jgi:DNA-binding Lrp family transcriptional regulator
MKNCTLDCTLDEIAVLNLLKTDGKLTQTQIAESINKSARTVKTITKNLENKELITRINGKRFGYWKVNI